MPTQARQVAEAAARAIEAGNHPEAEHLALRALEDNISEPLACEVLGIVRMGEGRHDEAIKYLEAGFRDAPTRAPLANLLGSAHASINKLKTAVTYFQKAAQLEPQSILFWENLGKAAYKMRRWSHARAAFEQCCTLDPENDDAKAGLARLELREDNNEQAIELASSIVARQPDHIMARQILAQANLKLGNAEEAYTHASVALTLKHNDAKSQTLTLGAIAEAADAVGHYDEAFDHFIAMNKAVEASLPRGAQQFHDTVNHEELRKIIATIPAIAEKISTWNKDFDTPAPIYLIGFPRCGLSSLHAKLKEHPLLVGAERRKVVAPLADVIRDERSWETIPAITEEEARTYRQMYWDNVKEAGIQVPPGARTLELKPFYSQHISSFVQPNPDGNWIFMHRDPRDIVVSAFQSRQVGRRSTFEFVTIESAAKYYNLVMTAAEVAREHFDLDIIELAFDDLAADVTGAALTVCEGLGLPLGDDVIDMLINAPEETLPRTNWRNYRKYVEPHRELLEPWIKKWGYPDWDA